MNSRVLSSINVADIASQNTVVTSLAAKIYESLISLPENAESSLIDGGTRLTQASMLVLTTTTRVSSNMVASYQ